MLQNKCEIRVRYADTDQMAFVWHGNYLEYFEVARTEMLRKTGLSYKSLEDTGYYLPLIESHTNYKTPGKYDEVLEITSEMREIPSAKMRVDYTVREKNSQRLIATGYTIHCFMRTGSYKVTRVPEIFISLVKKCFEDENI
ncbi:MAG: acyl-CoA thioesterase [Ignavibacteriales bacterium]|nr:thioesterase family protein [Ignavibacteriaceae bacterium]NLH60981.1 acyl-CoA thioesterase [Ignavibacteriales bacterium]HOJ17074.1 thioesterase family protein [Ignavibacteriaceae bacterium]HPO55082.1 thioesterase family protein [Ignavibacteriaceae bacterium]